MPAQRMCSRSVAEPATSRSSRAIALARSEPSCPCSASTPAAAMPAPPPARRGREAARRASGRRVDLSTRRGLRREGPAAPGGIRIVHALQRRDRVQPGAHRRRTEGLHAVRGLRTGARAMKVTSGAARRYDVRTDGDVTERAGSERGPSEVAGEECPRIQHHGGRKCTPTSTRTDRADALQRASSSEHPRRAVDEQRNRPAVNRAGTAGEGPAAAHYLEVELDAPELDEHPWTADQVVELLDSLLDDDQSGLA